MITRRPAPFPSLLRSPPGMFSFPPPSPSSPVVVLITWNSVDAAETTPTSCRNGATVSVGHVAARDCGATLSTRVGLRDGQRPYSYLQAQALDPPSDVIPRCKDFASTCTTHPKRGSDVIRHLVNHVFASVMDADAEPQRRAPPTGPDIQWTRRIRSSSAGRTRTGYIAVKVRLLTLCIRRRWVRGRDLNPRTRLMRPPRQPLLNPASLPTPAGRRIRRPAAQPHCLTL